MSKTTEFSQNIINEIGYYVYIYSDPDTRIPFYIGKGKGNRCFSHLSYKNDSEKVAKIQEILKSGKQPIIEILVHGVDEDTALKVEAAAIDLIGIENLTNIQKGHHSSVYGRIDVDDLARRYDQRMLTEDDIPEDVILIRVNKLYKYGMTDQELYDATRGIWRLDPEKAAKAKYAFAIYDGMVLEVYSIAAWFPALSTFTSRKDLAERETNDNTQKRFEFVGRIAPEDIRSKYVGCMVSNLFSKGNQNPIKYLYKE